MKRILDNVSQEDYSVKGLQDALKISDRKLSDQGPLVYIRRRDKQNTKILSSMEELGVELCCPYNEWNWRFTYGVELFILDTEDDLELYLMATILILNGLLALIQLYPTRELGTAKRR